MSNRTTHDELEAAQRDPWQWLHDNGFSWDDVNAIASILAHADLDIRPAVPTGQDLDEDAKTYIDDGGDEHPEPAA